MGLTKKEIAALYGPADDVRANAEEETWIYYLNVGKQLVLWNLGYPPELRVIRFDQAGRVKSWSHAR